MYFEQFYLGCLAHASYMIGSEGIAAVVDPQRDVEIYLDEARKNGLRIEHVIETHLHADFVSGHRELAARTGAKIYLGARAGAQFSHVALSDGDEIRFGQCRLQFLEDAWTYHRKHLRAGDGSRSRAGALGGAYRRHIVYRRCGPARSVTGLPAAAARRVTLRQPAREVIEFAGRSSRIPGARGRFAVRKANQRRALLHNRTAARDELRAESGEPGRVRPDADGSASGAAGLLCGRRRAQSRGRQAAGRAAGRAGVGCRRGSAATRERRFGAGHAARSPVRRGPRPGFGAYCPCGPVRRVGRYPDWTRNRPGAGWPKIPTVWKKPECAWRASASSGWSGIWQAVWRLRRARIWRSNRRRKSVYRISTGSCAKSTRMFKWWMSGGRPNGKRVTYRAPRRCR